MSNSAPETYSRPITSDEWWRFEEHTTRLTKVWRQGAGPFLDALNLTRSGDGGGAAALLSREGLEWHSALDIQFDGHTATAPREIVASFSKTHCQVVPLLMVFHRPPAHACGQ